MSDQSNRGANVVPFRSRPTRPPRKTCGWLMPVPEDAERGTKPQPCGKNAPFTIRVRDLKTYVEVDVCGPHRQEHNTAAAEARAKRRPA